MCQCLVPFVSVINCPEDPSYQGPRGHQYSQQGACYYHHVTSCECEVLIFRNSRTWETSPRPSRPPRSSRGSLTIPTTPWAQEVSRYSKCSLNSPIPRPSKNCYHPTHCPSIFLDHHQFLVLIIVTAYYLGYLS